MTTKQPNIVFFLHAARDAAAKVAQADGNALQVELVFESARSGKRRVVSPAKGVAAMAKSDVVSWGAFGLVFGLIVGFAGNGGILSSIENGVVTGVLWAMFGLAAGALYGLWACLIVRFNPVARGALLEV